MTTELIRVNKCDVHLQSGEGLPSLEVDFISNAYVSYNVYGNPGFCILDYREKVIKAVKELSKNQNHRTFKNFLKRFEVPSFVVIREIKNSKDAVKYYISLIELNKYYKKHFSSHALLIRVFEGNEIEMYPWNFYDAHIFEENKTSFVGVYDRSYLLEDKE